MNEAIGKVVHWSAWLPLDLRERFRVHLGVVTMLWRVSVLWALGTVPSLFCLHVNHATAKMDPTAVRRMGTLGKQPLSTPSHLEGCVLSWGPRGCHHDLWRPILFHKGKN